MKLEWPKPSVKVRAASWMVCTTHEIKLLGYKDEDNYTQCCSRDLSETSVLA